MWFETWLDRLSATTDYRELQAVFNEMANEVENTEDASQLARSIDEAIRRIEKERFSDEQELQSFETEYANFKEQQSGVLGWFKRTMPFTATRAEEKQHQAGIGEQQAEILADNFIIARAQVLKEKFLPPSSRRLGNDPGQWQQLLTESNGQITQLAQIIRGLGEEIERSEKFIEEVGEDIEAFHKADFTEREDDRLKQDQLKAAREELAPLQDELKREKELRSGAMTQARDVVHNELHQQNSTYRELWSQIERFEEAVSSISRTEKAAKEIESALDNMVRDSEELDSINSKIERLDRDAPQLETRIRQQQNREVAARQSLQQLIGSFESANDEVQNAEAAMKTAQRLYHAHLEETGQAEAVPGISSPVQREYENANDAFESAKRNLQNVRRPYDTAKNASDQAKRDLKEAEKKLEENSQQINKLQNDCNKLRDDIDRDRDRMIHEQYRMHDLIRDFLTGPGELIPNLRIEDALDDSYRKPHFSIGYNPTQEFKNHKQKTDKLLRAVRTDKSHIDQELEKARDQHRNIFLQRCRELLGADLVSEFD